MKESTDLKAIVSKWDEEGLKKYEGAERVDVTMGLVDLLKPTDGQRKRAVEIQDHAPGKE